MSKELSRRDFLWLLSCGTLGLVGGTVAAKVLGDVLEERASGPTSDEILRTTATHLAVTEVESSFVPEGHFTQEVYNRVREATYIIKVTMRDQKEAESSAEGTCWLAEGGFLVTNKHAFTWMQNAKMVGLQCRTADGSQIIPLNGCDIYFGKDGNSLDLAVIKIPGSVFPQAERLSYEDSFNITEGSRFLGVGYPGAFRKEDSIKARTWASTLVVEKYWDEHGVFVCKSVSGPGCSGSPVVGINSEGLVAIGTVRGGNETNASPLFGKEYYTYATTLNLGEILKMEPALSVPS